MKTAREEPMSEHQSQTSAAFDKLLGSLREAADKYLSSEHDITKETDIIEGHRYILHLSHGHESND